MTKRLMTILQIATVLALLLSACGGAATQTIVPEQPTAVQSQPQPTTPPPATEAKTAKVRVAMIIPGSIDDQSWNTGGYNSLTKLHDDLGVEVAYTEQVGVANVEQALRDYANQGYSLIIGHSFNYGDAIKKVAAEFPNVEFAWSQGYPPMPANVAAYNAPLEQSAYLSGMIGGLMTKSNKLGFIGGAKTPPMVAALGGYMAGAALVNPKVQVINTFPGVWDDVEKGKESAKAQFAAGVDFMMGRGDGIAEGSLEASKEAKVFCVGDVIDQNSLAPDLVVTSTVWDLSAVFKKILSEMQAGTFKGGMYNMGMKEGATDIAPFHGLVPDDIAAKVQAVRQQIIDGTFTVPVFTDVPTTDQLAAAPKPKLDLGVQPSTSTMQGYKVAMIIPGSIDDQSWNTGGYNSLTKLHDDLGVEVAYVEQVSVANAEQSLRDYASQGYSLIIGHSFNYGDAIKKVAAEFPNVEFAWSQGYPPMPANVAAYNAPLEQSAYLSGMIGGLMTKSNKLGFIGGAKTPPMVAALGGYMAGAALVNPKVQVINTFPGVWDDVEKGKESAKAQFAAGVDFMMGRGDGIAEGSLEASKEAKVFCVGDVIDQNSLAPDLVVTSTVWDLSAVFKKILSEMQAGTFKGGMYNMGMKEGATDIAPFHGLVPDDIAAKVQAVRQQIIDGTFTVPVFTDVPTTDQLAAAPKPTLP